MPVDCGPDWEFQTACVTALTANADIKALLGTPPRIYEDVPPNPVFPYVTLGECQIVPDRAECIEAAEVYPDFHIWSRTSSFKECKQIGATILAVITAATLTMEHYRAVDCYSGGCREVRDPDGKTRHGIQTIKALIDPI